MGWGRVIKSGIVGMLLLIPMAYISFRFLNLTEGVTGGLIANIDDALAVLAEELGDYEPEKTKKKAKASKNNKEFSIQITKIISQQFNIITEMIKARKSKK